MKIKDILTLCVGNLLRRKTRTILSVIGVVVGVCAIVVMVSIGVGLNVSFRSQIESFGNLHTVEIYNWGSGNGRGKSSKLDDSTIRKMSKIADLTAITPILDSSMTIGIGNMKTNAQIYGVDPSFIEKMNYELKDGRSLTEADADSNVLLFGYNVASRFYNPRLAEGPDWSNTEPTTNVISKNVVLTQDWNYGTNQEGTDDIKYETFKCEGVGLLSGTDNEASYRVYMPIKALEKIVKANQKAAGQQVTGNSREYSQALVYVSDINKVSDICKTIKEDYGFYTYSLQDMLKELQQTARTIEMVLGGIGAISLLVAAIGIANTMIMSVYERTREIGVMKVIGASLKDIQNMFLIEAGMIGFSGGIIGLCISFGLSTLMNTVLAGVFAGITGEASGTASVIPWWLALGALAFATMVGIISGWLPARRAMNLSALEGLKNE